MDRRLWWFLGVGLVVALLVAGVLSGFASGDPDGLERVSIDEGFDETAQDHALADSPLADYAVEGVEDERLSTGLAGIIGVTITLVLSGALFYSIRLYGKARRGKEAA
ncbi:MAG: PDGLE domain-containing protein [Actinomycetota bacterium]